MSGLKERDLKQLEEHAAAGQIERVEVVTARLQITRPRFLVTTLTRALLKASVSPWTERRHCSEIQ